MRVIQNAYLLLLTHTKQLLLVTFCDTNAGIEYLNVRQTDGKHMDRQT